MTGPRISNTSLETLKRILGMATKPDATRTPDSKASLDDLMRQLTGGGTVSNRYEGPPLAIPISQSAMPEYIEGPGGVPKIVGKVGEGLKKVLGVSGKEPLVQAAKDVPEYLTGPAMRQKATKRVFARDDFDGGHEAVWDDIKNEVYGKTPSRVMGNDGKYIRDNMFSDGFVTNTNRFVDRHTAIEIARANSQLKKGAGTSSGFILSEKLKPVAKP
jgi:hypothetical protein